MNHSRTAMCKLDSTVLETVLPFNFLSSSDKQLCWMAFAYPANHWAVLSGVESTARLLPYAVAVLRVRLPSGATTSVLLYLNPTDARNYRMLMRPLVQSASQLPHNAFATQHHSAALHVATGVVADVFWKATGLYIQTYQLGNNSQSTDPLTGGVALMGNEHEPYFLHIHCVCRGDPSRRYLGDSLPPLRGPPIGSAFPMVSCSDGVSANVPWSNSEELASAAGAVRALLLAALPDALDDSVRNWVAFDVVQS
jgi:hypothetical protein